VRTPLVLYEHHRFCRKTTAQDAHLVRFLIKEWPTAMEQLENLWFPTEPAPKVISGPRPPLKSNITALAVRSVLWKMSLVGVTCFIQILMESSVFYFGSPNSQKKAPRVMQHIAFGEHQPGAKSNK